MVVAASLREKESGPMPVPVAANSKTASAPDSKQPTGTVVLEVEQGGIEVPSFLGKTVRAAIEAAEDSGLELEVVGSGIARDQTPTQGSHVAAGSRIVVHFER